MIIFKLNIITVVVIQAYHMVHLQRYVCGKLVTLDCIPREEALEYRFQRTKCSFYSHFADNPNETLQTEKRMFLAIFRSVSTAELLVWSSRILEMRSFTSRYFRARRGGCCPTSNCAIFNSWSACSSFRHLKKAHRFGRQQSTLDWNNKEDNDRLI